MEIYSAMCMICLAYIFENYLGKRIEEQFRLLRRCPTPGCEGFLTKAYHCPYFKSDWVIMRGDQSYRSFRGKSLTTESMCATNSWEASSIPTHSCSICARSQFLERETAPEIMYCEECGLAFNVMSSEIGYTDYWSKKPALNPHFKPFLERVRHYLSVRSDDSLRITDSQSKYEYELLLAKKIGWVDEDNYITSHGKQAICNMILTDIPQPLQEVVVRFISDAKIHDGEKWITSTAENSSMFNFRNNAPMAFIDANILIKGLDKKQKLLLGLRSKVQTGELRDLPTSVIPLLYSLNGIAKCGINKLILGEFITNTQNPKRIPADLKLIYTHCLVFPLYPALFSFATIFSEIIIENLDREATDIKDIYHYLSARKEGADVMISEDKDLLGLEKFYTIMRCNPEYLKSAIKEAIERYTRLYSLERGQLGGDVVRSIFQDILDPSGNLQVLSLRDREKIISIMEA